jgi:hypothetical protein
LEVDKYHFSIRRKKTTFHLQANIFSLVIKNKSSLEIIDHKLKEYKFKKDELWSYDPFCIIFIEDTIKELNTYLNYEEQGKFRLFSNLDKDQNQFSMTFVQP